MNGAAFLAQFSDALADRVAEAAPMLAAVRIAAGRHVSALLWRADLLLTAELSLPAQDSYTVVMPGGFLGAATLAVRHPALNLAVLRVAALTPGVPIRAPAEPRIGALAIALAASAEATPEARLAMISGEQRLAGNETALLLDLPPYASQDGGPAIGPDGTLLGMITTNAAGQVQVLPHRAIQQALTGRAATMAAAPLAAVAPQPILRSTPSTPGALEMPAPLAAELRRTRNSGPRAWLGAALQPISLPDQLRGIAGQDSGRKVVRLSPRGPADRAGLRLGDIVLALDGQSVGGTQSIRAMLGPERIGSEAEVRMLREGRLAHIRVMVLSEPMGE